VVEHAEYTGEIKEQIARMEGRYTIRVVRDGWTEIPLMLRDATITAVALKEKSGEAHLIPRDGAYVFVTTRKGTYHLQVKFSRLLAQENQQEALRFWIPQATFSTMTVFVPRKDVELRPIDQLYVDREPDALRAGTRLTARLGAADRVDLGWNTRPTAPEKVEPVVYGEVHTLVTLEDQLARLHSIIVYRMAQGETRELQVTVPSTVSILNLRGATIDDWRIAQTGDHKTLTVMLTKPLKDTLYRLILEGEETRGEGSATYRLPELTLIGAKQERGYIAVARAGNIEVNPQEVEGITRIDARELPDLLTTSVATPAVLAFRYPQHPYQILVGVTRHQDHPVLAAIAERAELTTVLSRQGELLTRAAYLIKANKKQFLEARLPDGATLWSCIVNGTSVKPVEGSDGMLRVPLSTSLDAAQTVPVEIVYFERRPAFQGVGSFHLSGPTLDVPTTIANWSLFTPKDVKFLRMSGNLERGAAAFAFLDDPFIQTAVAEEVNRAEDWRAALKQLSRRAVGFGGALRGKQRTYQAQSGAEGDIVENQPAYPSAPSAATVENRTDGAFGAWIDHASETGILPLKIQLPKAGTVYRFNRLVTAEEALMLDATFVHLRMPWIPLTAAGLLVFPIGGLAMVRMRRH